MNIRTQFATGKIFFANRDLHLKGILAIYSTRPGRENFNGRNKDAVAIFAVFGTPVATSSSTLKISNRV